MNGEQIFALAVISGEIFFVLKWFVRTVNKNFKFVQSDIYVCEEEIIRLERWLLKEKARLKREKRGD